VDVLPVKDESGLFEAVAELVQVGREEGREAQHTNHLIHSTIPLPLPPPLP